MWTPKVGAKEPFQFYDWTNPWFFCWSAFQNWGPWLLQGNLSQGLWSQRFRGQHLHHGHQRLRHHPGSIRRDETCRTKKLISHCRPIAVELFCVITVEYLSTEVNWSKLSELNWARGNLSLDISLRILNKYSKHPNFVLVRYLNMYF